MQSTTLKRLSRADLDGLTAFATKVSGIVTKDRAVNPERDIAAIQARLPDLKAMIARRAETRHMGAKGVEFWLACFPYQGGDRPYGVHMDAAALVDVIEAGLAALAAPVRA